LICFLLKLVAQTIPSIMGVSKTVTLD